MVETGLTRRNFLGHVGGAYLATAMVAGTATATGTVSKLIGAKDAPYKSQKFTETGYYAFGRGDGSGMRVLYAEADQSEHWQDFIALSNGPGLPPVAHLSSQSFDYACWGGVRNG